MPRILQDEQLESWRTVPLLAVSQRRSAVPELSLSAHAQARMSTRIPLLQAHFISSCSAELSALHAWHCTALYTIVARVLP